MPIRPENKARYPKDWNAISLAIRERSGQRCECMGECGVSHNITTLTAESGRCYAINYKAHPITGSKVILTVAHLDHIPENCDPSNLKAMCQRCHNRYDMPMRRKGIADRKAAALAISQPQLFEDKT